jgi:PKD repeat protein
MTMNMRRTHQPHQLIALAGLVLASIVSGACSLDKQDMPALSGPSELGLSLTMTASPDQLPRDGSSQSVVTLTARDAQGRPLAGQRVTLGASGGTLSQDTVVTGSDGHTTFAVTAPQQNVVVSGNQIVVSALPVGQNSDNAVPRRISILLTGVSNSTEPVPSFAVTPQAPEINQTGTFDATATTDEGGQCLDMCTYAWNFDDGSTASGRIVTHAFSVARSYNVALTVTDASGLVVVLRKLVTPTAPAEPTATLNVSPNPPVVNQVATFNATGTAASGHSIVRYEWDFGDGVTTSTSGGNVTHTYGSRGIFTAVVRAIDDLGRAGSANLQLNLTTGVPTGINAQFFFTPIDSSAGQTVYFDANASTASNGATITNYRWDWGDGTSEDDGTTPTASHAFGASHKYVVKLTITDSQGRTSSTTQTITIG